MFTTHWTACCDEPAPGRTSWCWGMDALSGWTAGTAAQGQPQSTAPMGNTRNSQQPSAVKTATTRFVARESV